MNIKTVTTYDGVNVVDFGSAASRFYWFRNIGTSTVYVSGNSDITAGGDGVAELAVDDSVCVEALGGKVYVLGAGKVQIHNTGDKFCPFKNAPAQSGGEAVDAYTKTESDAKYAQKTDIPSSLPANGGNADTVDGHHADYFAKYNNPSIEGQLFLVRAGNATTADSIFAWEDTLRLRNQDPNAENTTYTDLLLTPSGIFTEGMSNGNSISRKEISTTPIKKISFPSVGTNAGGGGSLFSAAFGTPITIACTSRGDTQCTPFYYGDGNQWLLLAKDATTLDPIPAGSYSFDVWYI